MQICLVMCFRARLSDMSTLAASHFVSRTSPVNGGSVSETRTNLGQMGLWNQPMTHNGLRSLSNLDMLRIKARPNAVPRQAMKKADKTEGDQCVGKIVCGRGMNLVFVGAEVGPWSKTGGLGDVLGGLPPALAANGHRVMTVSPRYDQYKDAWDTSVLVEIEVDGKIETVRFFHCYKRGVDRVFVDHPLFLERAALEAPRVLNLNSNKYFSGPYGEDVVFVANDWHTALIPCYLKTIYKPRGLYKMPRYAKPVKGRKINWMKAGILESDRVVTVSPYYAQELISGEDKGVELDNIIRKTGITGIINGMDVQEWNPARDKYLDVKYDNTTVLDAKPLLKEALQAEVGLPVDRDIPVIGFIGRLEEQKGSDILVEAISKFIGEEVQIIILVSICDESAFFTLLLSAVGIEGTGKNYLETQIKQLEIKYPGKAVGVAKFNVPLAHMIIGGADFMLIPSRFEPCGLIQLHAMRYGTVPIVASTGGLVDTVKEGFTGFQMGAFNVECDEVDPADVTAIATTVKRALAAYATPALNEMIQNCMAQDLSWKGPSKQWEKMLLSLEVAGGEPGIEGEEIAPLAKENVPTP
ncbi:UDP-Glycosyltransferase superfamily protein [Prunus dulcis]|uniref:UDP-Glycosyltransferase superfamily protein n=1 Tax=Prunus dulcis TaxID=3755 RepID=A0A4Y1RGY6_PRUDU|nr:UDP-Glycosyltransferase superfamily protein [Prunus dulcis]